MLWIEVDCNLELLDRILVLLELMQDFSETEVCWNALRFQFAAMLEVLLSLREVTRVSQLRSQVDASTEVRLVVEKYLLEVVH
jgi:hypothetical protein